MIWKKSFFVIQWDDNHKKGANKMEKDAKRGCFSVMLSESCRDAIEVVASTTVIFALLGAMGLIGDDWSGLLYFLIHASASALAGTFTTRYANYVIKRKIYSFMMYMLAGFEAVSCAIVLYVVLSWRKKGDFFIVALFHIYGQKK